MDTATSTPLTKKQRCDSDSTSSEPYVLYSYWRSSCSWRVRIALAYKEIKYTYQPVHLVKNGGEQFSEDYTKKNPSQRVPLLKIGNDAEISQSGAILQYLEDVHPEKLLLPKDPLEKAKVNQICDIIGCDIQPIQNLAVLKKFSSYLPEEKSGEGKIEWGHYWIDNGFKALENVLTQTSGKYCFGDSVTLADVYLVPQVYNANRFKVDMKKYPVISRIHDELIQLPAFIAAEPSNMTDAE